MKAKFGLLEENMVAIIIYVVLTVVLTYPVVISPGDTIHDLGDPLLYCWLMSWEALTMFNNPAMFFNGNIFYPLKNTVAFSDHMIGTTLLFLFPYLVTGNSIFSHNMVFLSTFFISGIGMFLLVRYYDQGFIPAILAGIIFSFAPYRFAHAGHLTLLSMQWFPFCVLMWEKYCSTLNPWHFMGYLIFYLIQVLSSWYLGIFITFTMGMLWVWRLWINKTNRLKMLKLLIPGKLIIFLALIPFILPYLEVSRTFNMTRSIQESDQYSADVMDYLFTSPRNLLYGSLFSRYRNDTAYSEHSLFPGICAVVLAIVPLVQVVTGKHKLPVIYRFYLSMGIIVFVLSLGPWLKIHGFNTGISLPYLYLYKVIPVLKGIRAPSRFVTVILFCLSVLSAFGMNRVLKRIRSFSARIVIITVIFVFMILEYMNVPLASVDVNIDPNGSYEFLAKVPVEGTLLELPMGFYKGSTHNFLINAKYMLGSTIHWRNLLNGYSGFHPESFLEMTAIFHEFDPAKVTKFFKAGNVKFILVHADNIPADKLRIMFNYFDTHKRVSFVRKFGNDYLYTWD